MQALTGTFDRRQTHILAKAFYLNKDKLFAGYKLIFLVVHVHGVNFPKVVHLTGSFLTFTYSVFYFKKVFLVLNLNTYF
jgi:hypothetical protein